MEQAFQAIPIMSTTRVKVTNPATPHESVATAPPDMSRILQSVFDPFGMYASIFQSQQAWAQHPQAPGTWWQDWTRWLAKQCGPLRAPPPMQTEKYPALCPAPGTYVLEH
jgi:hypothetical protein